MRRDTRIIDTDIEKLVKENRSETATKMRDISGAEMEGIENVYSCVSELGMQAFLATEALEGNYQGGSRMVFSELIEDALRTMPEELPDNLYSKVASVLNRADIEMNIAYENLKGIWMELGHLEDELRDVCDQMNQSN